MDKLILVLLVQIQIDKLATIVTVMMGILTLGFLNARNVHTHVLIVLLPLFV